MYALQLYYAPDPTLPASWVSYKKGEPYPRGIVIAGYDEENYPIAVARFTVEGDLLPGTLRLRNCDLNVSWDGRKWIAGNNFQILCNGNVEWVESHFGHVHSQAVKGGKAYAGDSVDFEELFIGKITFNGVETVGKVHPEHRCLYIAWNDREIRVDSNYYQLIDLNSASKKPISDAIWRTVLNRISKYKANI